MVASPRIPHDAQDHVLAPAARAEVGVRVAAREIAPPASIQANRTATITRQIQATCRTAAARLTWDFRASRSSRPMSPNATPVISGFQGVPEGAADQPVTHPGFLVLGRPEGKPHGQDRQHAGSPGGVRQQVGRERDDKREPAARARSGDPRGENSQPRQPQDRQPHSYGDHGFVAEQSDGFGDRVPAAEDIPDCHAVDDQRGRVVAEPFGLQVVTSRRGSRSGPVHRLGGHRIGGATSAPRASAAATLTPGTTR